MMRYSFFKTSNLKKTLILLFTVLMVLAITVLILSEIITLQPDSVQKSITDKFNKIEGQLEFNGLTDTVKAMTKDYSELFDGFSNMIISDDAGNILFQINRGYISEKNKFLVLVDPWSTNGNNIVYLIDSKNNVKYPAKMDISLNLNKLKEQSAKNPLADVLFLQPIDTDDLFGDKTIKNDDGSSFLMSSESKIIMNYAYIASKQLNLYSLYDSDHQYNNYFLFANALTNAKHWLLLLAVILLMPFCILSSVWIFKNIKKRNYSK